MLCPHDQSDLVISERSGVEIDYCPTCRGVWLDRGELDKIIDRSMELEIAAEVMRPSARSSARGRESWLGDLFDY
jgi:Zn-finger nucleic acid-binding protein